MFNFSVQGEQDHLISKRRENLRALGGEIKKKAMVNKKYRDELLFAVFIFGL